MRRNRVDSPFLKPLRVCDESFMIRDPAKPGRKSKPAPQPKRRRAGFRAAAQLTPEALKQVGAKRGFAEAKLLTHWTEIAGEALAGICRPIKVSYASRTASLGATLVLAADGARGPEIDAQKTRIIERVNSYYGYRAVSRISIDQTRSPARMQGFAEPAAAFEGPKSAPRPVEGVTDERLALALGRLGANIRSKAARKRRAVKGETET